MDLRVLKYYLALCREETISKASEAVHLSQPSMSRQLSHLEKEFGKKLFIRGKKKIVLTEDGILLRKRAEEIVALADKTEEELSSSSEDVIGRVDIGGGESPTLRFIFQAGKNVMDIYPGIVFSYISGDSGDIKDDLDKGLYDFALLYGDLDEERYEIQNLPFADEVGVLVRKDSPLASHDYITLDELADQPLIVSRQQSLNGTVKKLFGSRKYHPAIFYNLFYSASLMVRAGLGVALGIKGIINVKDTDLKYLPIHPLSSMQIKLVHSRNKPLSKSDRIFKEELIKVIEEYQSRLKGN